MYLNNLLSNSKMEKRLSDDEFMDLYLKMKKGDMNARDKIILSNVGFVIAIVITRFSGIDLEQNDLFELGIIGLINAVDSFDISKNVKFSTYTYTCIYNEILMMLRKKSKSPVCASIDENIRNDKDEDEFRIIDVIEDENANIENFQFNKILLDLVKNAIYDLPKFDRDIVIKYFGLDGNDPLRQPEIAKCYNVSQSYISRIIRRSLKSVKEKLIQDGMCDDKLVLNK